MSARYAALKHKGHDITVLSKDNYIGPAGTIPTKDGGQANGGLANWGGNLFFPSSNKMAPEALLDFLQVVQTPRSSEFYATSHGTGMLLNKNSVPSFGDVQIIRGEAINLGYKEGRYRVLLNNGNKLDTDRVIICTGGSSELTLNCNRLFFGAAKTNLLDKAMFIEPTDLPVGVYTDQSESGVARMRYVMRGRVFREGLENTYLRLVHMFNKQHSIAKTEFLRDNDLLNLWRILGRRTCQVSLTTVSYPEKGYPWRLINDVWKYDSLNHEYKEASLLNRALHIDFRQNPEILEWLDRNRIPSDQFSTIEESFKFGSVGYRVMRVMEKIKKLT